MVFLNNIVIPRSTYFASYRKLFLVGSTSTKYLSHTNLNFLPVLSSDFQERSILSFFY